MTVIIASLIPRPFVPDLFHSFGENWDRIPGITFMWADATVTSLEALVALYAMTFESGSYDVMVALSHMQNHLKLPSCQSCELGRKHAGGMKLNYCSCDLPIIVCSHSRAGCSFCTCTLYNQPVSVVGTCMVVYEAMTQVLHRPNKLAYSHTGINSRQMHWILRFYERVASMECLASVPMFPSQHPCRPTLLQ